MASTHPNGFSRRDFIKLGTVGGITLLLGRLPTAQAVEVNSGPSPTDWMGSNGKPKFRWDAIRKVTGEKNFSLTSGPRTCRAGQNSRAMPSCSRPRMRSIALKALIYPCWALICSQTGCCCKRPGRQRPASTRQHGQGLLWRTYSAAGW